MTSDCVVHLINDVDLLIKRIDDSYNLDSREKSYLAQYLVVYICGTYEECIENILTLWAMKTGSNELVTFVDKYLDDFFRNPDCEKIIELLKRFNEEWAEEIADMPKFVKDSLNSIILNKNHVAHGKKCNATLDEVKKWYEASKQILLRIDQTILT